MTNKEKVIQFWSTEKAALMSYPKHRGRWPDDDTIAILKRLCRGNVCEVGCGTGRCSDAFTRKRYVGVDINKDAIRIAQQENPGYSFSLIDWDALYPLAETYLFYTTLQHIPDEDIPGVLARLKGRVVIQEIMLREFRNEMKLRFHRTPDEYMHLLGAAGFRIEKVEEHPTNYQVNKFGKPKFKRRFMVAEYI